MDYLSETDTILIGASRRRITALGADVTGISFQQPETTFGFGVVGDSYPATDYLLQKFAEALGKLRGLPALPVAKIDPALFH